MKVLIACEFSGRVRDAFAARGQDSWSCDLLPSETPGQHIQGDVLRILGDHWDLMIAFPPCQYLSVAGNRANYDPVRRLHSIKALAFLATLYWSEIPRVAVENPMGLANTMFKKPSQRIEPYQFGDYERKRTFLWLRRLPPLTPTAAIVPPPAPRHVTQGTGKRWYWTNGGSPGKRRSRTFPGIARAMAEQWGALG
jgi:hypothetical protein